MLKPHLTAFLILLAFSTVPLHAQNALTPAGCVIFQLSSEAVPSMVEYRSYRNLGSHIQVNASNGELVRVFQGQNPIFIPYPTSAGGGMPKSLIDRARKAYPGMSRHLASVQSAWSAAARRKSTATNKPRRGTPARIETDPAPPTPATIDLTTTTGKVYRGIRILRPDPDGLVIATDTGTDKVPFDQLSPELQKQYGYNPEAAAVYLAKKREEMARVQAKKDEEKQKELAAEAEESMRRKLKSAIDQGATQLFGQVLQKKDEGVLITTVEPGSSERLPGVGHANSVVLLKGCPRSPGWVKGDPVNVLGVADGTHNYTDVQGIRQTARAFRWILNPLTDSP